MAKVYVAEAMGTAVSRVYWVHVHMENVLYKFIIITFFSDRILEVGLLSMCTDKQLNGYGQHLLMNEQKKNSFFFKWIALACFQFAEGVILNLETMWEESNKRTPLVGFLSMGSDPTENIERLAKQKGLSEYYSFLHSMQECLWNLQSVVLIVKFTSSFSTYW